MHCLALRLRLLPVLAKDLTHPAVMPTALAVELLPLDAGLAVAGLLERALGSLVLHERAGADLVQVQLAKAERGPERHGLGRDALAPKRLVTDGQTGLPVSVPPVDRHAANARQAAAASAASTFSVTSARLYARRTRCLTSFMPIVRKTSSRKASFWRRYGRSCDESSSSIATMGLKVRG